MNANRSLLGRQKQKQKRCLYITSGCICYYIFCGTRRCKMCRIIGIERLQAKKNYFCKTEKSEWIIEECFLYI